MAPAPVRPRRALGLAILAAFALAVLGGYLRPNPFSSDETVRAVFTNASGVGKVGLDVRMAGTPVGRITGVKRQGNDAVLTFKLKKEAGTIHRDARASLRPRLAFEGTAFVDLDPGSPHSPALPSDSALPASHTRTYVALDEALRVARPPTRRSLKQDARDLRVVLGPAGQDGLRRTLAQAPALTRGLAVTARAARGVRPGHLAGVVKGFGDTADAVVAQEQSVGPLLRGAQHTLAAVDTDSGQPLDQTVAQLAPTLADAASGGRALDDVLVRLRPLSRELVPTMRELDPALRDLRPLLREARPVVADARPLVTDLRGTVGEGGRAAAPLRRMLTTLQPTLTVLDRSLLPALAKPTDVGLPSYLAFLNLFEGGGGASRTFQTGDQKGHFMRFGARFFTGVGYPLPPCTLLAQVNAQMAQNLGQAGVCSQ